MLSSPSPSPQKRQRLHRRQNSTPTALEAAKGQNLPAPGMRRYAMHRRGLSLDHQSPNRQPLQTVPDGSSCAATNTELYRNPHELREAQRKRLTRSGHSYSDQSSTPMSSTDGCQAVCQSDMHSLTNQSSSENHPGTVCMNSDSFGTDSQGSDNLFLKEALERIQRQHIGDLSLPCSSLNHDLLNNTTWGLYNVEGEDTIQSFGNTHPAYSRRVSVQSSFGPQIYRPATPSEQVAPSKQK
jgi:hypothetical protein